MTPLFLPESQLLYAVNIAIATSVACLVTIFVGSRRRFSLPFRHAVFASGLAACVVSPAIIPVSQQFAGTSVFQYFGPSQRLASPKSLAVVDLPSAESRLASSGVSVMEFPPARRDDSTSDTLHLATGFEEKDKVTREDDIAREQAGETTYSISQILGSIFVAVWLVGTIVTLSKTFAGHRCVSRLISNCSVAKDESLLAALRKAGRVVEVDKLPPLLQSDSIPVPIVVGILRPKIVLPDDAESTFSESELQNVLTHELAHVARRDHWISALQSISLVLYWWKPLVRYISQRVSAAREYLCDDIVTTKNAESGQYAGTIVQIAERLVASPTSSAFLGLGLSQTSELESRIRRILNKSAAIVTVRLGWPASLAVVATSLLMLVGIAIAQVPADANTKPGTQENEKRASVEQLMEAVAKHERNYMPYHVKAMQTFRMNQGLSARDKRRYPWADGRKNQRLMEYGQRGLDVWLRKETMLKDDEVRSQFDQYNEPTQQIKVSERPGSDDGLQVHLEKGHRMKMVFCTPYAGIFPLSVYSESMPLSEAVATNKTRVSLDWDNQDAVLEFKFGWVDSPMRFLLWLSHKHDWHPVKLQRFSTDTSKQFFSEWRATRLDRESGVWRVKEGTLAYRHYEDAELDDAKVMYFVDFEILASEFGDVVTSDRFSYEIPGHAQVHDVSKPADSKKLGKLRPMSVTVIGIDEKPIEGATVRFQTTDGEEVETVTTDDKGVAKTSQAPTNVSIDVTAPNHRRADWTNGPQSNEFRVILAPTTTGTTNSVAGEPIADAWITSELLRFRPDGLAYIPRHAFANRENDWSDKSGEFVLRTGLTTLRRIDESIRLAAVDDSVDNMAFALVPALDLGKPLNLALKPVCRVQGSFVFDNVAQESEFHARIEDASGRHIAGATPSVRTENTKTHVTFKLRLPEGRYQLRSRGSSFYPAFSVSLVIQPEQRQLDFGSIPIAAEGLSSLLGQTAPEFQFKSHSQQDLDPADLRGSVVVLDFWGHWCIPCVEDMPRLMDIAEQFKNKPIRWIAVHNPSLSTLEELDEEIAKLEKDSWKRTMRFKAVLDIPEKPGDRTGVTAKRFGVREWPTIVIVGKDGTVVGPATKQTLVAKLKDILTTSP